MRRRQTLSAIGSGIAITLAGCSSITGGGGASKEIVTNDYSDVLKASLGSLENTEVLGTDAVIVPVTVENTGDSNIEVGLQAEFYDGDTNIGTDDASKYSPKEIPSGEKKEFDQGVEGRKDDVTKVEVMLRDPENIESDSL